MKKTQWPDSAFVTQFVRAIGITEASPAPLAFTCGLMTTFGPVVHPGTGLDKDVFDAGELSASSLFFAPRELDRRRQTLLNAGERRVVRDQACGRIRTGVPFYIVIRIVTMRHYAGT